MAVGKATCQTLWSLNSLGSHTTLTRVISTSMWERENIHLIYCVFSPLFRDINNLDSTFRVCLDITYFAETENRKYYSKIIFKCVNSVVEPIFNEKVPETWNLWVYEQCMNALFTVEKSTFACTVHSGKVNLCGYCSMNSSHITPCNAWKKKRKVNSQTQT